MDAPFAVRLVRYAHTLLVVATTLVAAARPRTVRRHLRNTQVAMKIAKAEDRLRGKHPKLNLPGSSPRRGAEVRRVSLRRTRPGQRLKIRMSDFGREAARQRARLYEHHATWVRWRIVTGHQHRLWVVTQPGGQEGSVRKCPHPRRRNRYRHAGPPARRWTFGERAERNRDRTRPASGHAHGRAGASRRCAPGAVPVEPAPNDLGLQDSGPV